MPAASQLREWDLAVVDESPEALPARFSSLDPYTVAFVRGGFTAVSFLLSMESAWWSVSLRRNADALRDSPTDVPHASGRAETFEPGVNIVVQVRTSPPGGLSPRETEIASLIAGGSSDKQIANRLGTSVRTVSTQISRLLAKTGSPNRSLLAASVASEGRIVLPIPGPPNPASPLSVIRLDAEERLPGSGEHFSGTQIRKADTVLRRAALRIGVITTTGAFADDGLEAFRGAELALREISTRHHGPDARPFETLRIDLDPLDPTSVSHGLAKLADADIDGVLSTYASALDPSIIEFAGSLGKPFLHTNTWTESARLVERDPDRFAHLFQTSPTERSYTAALSDFLEHARSTGALIAPRVSVIELGDYGCRITSDDLSRSLERNGIRLVSALQVALDVSDQQAIRFATTALNHNPGLVIVSLLNVEAAVRIQRALRQISRATPVYHLYTPSVPRFFQELKEDGEGVMWATTTGRNLDVLGERFASAFRRAYGVAPGWSQSSAAYDQAQLLAQAFVASGSRHPDDVSRVLRAITHRGVNGTYFLGGPNQTVAGYPFDSVDRTLATPHVTYRYAQGKMQVLS